MTAEQSAGGGATLGARQQQPPPEAQYTSQAFMAASIQEHYNQSRAPVPMPDIMSGGSRTEAALAGGMRSRSQLGAFEDAPIDVRPREERRRDEPSRDRGSDRVEDRDRDRRDRSRERERGRDRDRDRERRRSRSGDRRRRSRSREESRSSRGRDRGGRPDSPDNAYAMWKARKMARQGRSNFDIPPPPGSDGIPAAGFPISCMATLPISQSNNVFAAMGGLGTAGSLTSASASMQQTKNARRLYVGGIPAGTDEQEVTRFFNETISKATNGAEGPCPVLSVYINHEKCFAFVELTSVELTTACCAFDGIEFRGRMGTVIIRVRRPNDFRPELLPAPTRPIPTLNLGGMSVVGTTVGDGPNKIFVGGIPNNLGEEQVRELLEAFGPLKAFHLVKDMVTGTTKGYGFCEYLDSAVTPKAVEGLNNLQIGEKILTVRVNNLVSGQDPSQPLAIANGKEPTSVANYSSPHLYYFCI